MPRPALKTRSRRRVYVKLPGGGLRLHFKPEKPGPARCAWCGSMLGGVPRLLPHELKKFPRSSRRPTRPYGGHLCHSCLRLGLQRAILEAKG
ncbi:MAG: 50S ribosomal protein L34e [Candidatus Nezhaarchaeota archaeon]|nr:50S ribosomal protein L34e [Candidatus Nezhaarchaeota archaeon]